MTAFTIKKPSELKVSGCNQETVDGFLEQLKGGWTPAPDAIKATADGYVLQGAEIVRSLQLFGGDQQVVVTLATADSPPPRLSVGERMWVDLSDVTMDEGTQIPGRTNFQQVEAYAELMVAGLWDVERDPLPVLYYSRKDKKSYPGDAHHRVLAGTKAGLEALYFEVREGELVDAILHSCRAEENSKHGLPLTPRDQRNRIQLFLDTLELMSEEKRRKLFLDSPKFTDYQKERYTGWSGRAIAKYLNLAESGYKTVQKIMGERALSERISQSALKVGDRASLTQPLTVFEVSLPIGTLGKIASVDSKKGLLFLPDGTDKSAWAHPDSVAASTAPWVQPMTETSDDDQPSLEPDDEWEPQVGDRIEVKSGVFVGQVGEVTAFPSVGFALVALDNGDGVRQRIPFDHLKPESQETEQVEETKEPEAAKPPTPTLVKPASTDEICLSFKSNLPWMKADRMVDASIAIASHLDERKLRQMENEQLESLVRACEALADKGRELLGDRNIKLSA